MFGKVPDDSFQNIFDLSFDSDDVTKCVTGSRGLDFLSALSPNNTLNSFNIVNNNNNNNSNCVKNKNNSSRANQSPFESNDDEKSWRNVFLNAPSGQQQEELEQAFAKLYSGHKPSASVQDAFASSFFPFSLSSVAASEKVKSDSHGVDNNSSRKLLYSAAVGQSNGSSASSTCSSSSSSAISCPNSTSSSSSTGSLPATKVNPSRYKTELCRPYQENGTCKYGDKCQFAHGHSELRTVNRHPKYKTDLCRTYHSVGFCPYGPRCHFIHSLDEVANATATTSRNSPVPSATPSSSSSSPSTPTASATTNEIAAAIAALRQLPIFAPERVVAAPPGFGPRPPRLGLNSSAETSGVSSVSSLSPSMLTDLEDGHESLLPRLPVFSRFHN